MAATLNDAPLRGSLRGPRRSERLRLLGVGSGGSARPSLHHRLFSFSPCRGEEARGVRMIGTSDGGENGNAFHEAHGRLFRPKTSLT